MMIQDLQEGQTGRLIGGLSLDHSEIPQSLLNIENKDRSNPFPWNGQFSPQLVEALLNTYAASNAVVLDPFAGSGTVLYEAGRKGLSAIGTEINPAAYLMASVYQMMNVELRRREEIVFQVDSLIRQAFPEKLPLFFPIASTLTEETIKNVLISFQTTLSDSSACRLLQSLIVRLDFYQPGLNEEKVLTVWNKLRSFIQGLPHSENRIEVYNCDARTIPVPPEIVDLVITSPPYINVFNYHQQYRASTEAMGWDVLTVAKSEIGSNRKNRGNRFLTVIQYCLDLAQVLKRLASLLRKSGRVIFVVGRESRVRGVPFFNGEIVSALGTKCAGFNLKLRQERVFKNKFGEMIYEDILHFDQPSKQFEDPLPQARTIADGVLLEAIKQSFGKIADDVITDLESARESVVGVMPSPLYRTEAACKIGTAERRKEFHPSA